MTDNQPQEQTVAKSSLRIPIDANGQLIYIPNERLLYQDAHTSRDIMWPSRENQEAVYEEHLAALAPRDHPGTFEEAVQHLITWSGAVRVHTRLVTAQADLRLQSFRAKHAHVLKESPNDDHEWFSKGFLKDATEAYLDRVEAREETLAAKIINVDSSDNESGTPDSSERRL